MTSSILPGRRALVVLLVLAPTLELVEALASPLRNGSTTSEMGRIADHQTAFAISALSGLAATLLYLPMFLGLANACRLVSPRLATITGWVAASSMMCFMGIRAVGAVQLQSIRDGLDRKQTSSMLDHLAANPIGTPMFVVFLLGALVGLICLGVLVWRAGLPKPAAVLLIAFQPADLAIPGHWGTVASHVLLATGLIWIAGAMRTRVSTPHPSIHPGASRSLPRDIDRRAPCPSTHTRSGPHPPP